MDSYDHSTDLLRAEYCDLEQIRNYLALLTLPIELRIPVTKVRTLSGYFDDLDSLVLMCKHLSGNSFKGAKIEAVYTTLNPLNPDLLARSCNRLADYARNTTGDKDVTRRIWLPIDVDPVRPAGICANDQEKKAALDTARAVGQFLAEAGFPDPLVGDSGNGGHLLYRVDLDNSEEVKNALMRFYELLAREFNTPATTVDTTVYNAARIWKVYGTRVCKGDEVGDRVQTQPHDAQRRHQPAGVQDQEVRKLGALAGTRRQGGCDRQGRRHSLRLRPHRADAHHLIWLADKEGVQDRVVEALFRAYFTEGRDISKRQRLLDMVAEGGLDRGKADAVLDSGDGLEAVGEADQFARRHQVQGVPFFVVNGTLTLSGAEPPDAFLEAFRQAVTDK